MFSHGLKPAYQWPCVTDLHWNITFPEELYSLRACHHQCFRVLVYLICKNWPSTSSAFTHVTYLSSLFSRREIVYIEALHLNSLFFFLSSFNTEEEKKTERNEKKRNKKQVFLRASDDGTAKKFHFNIHFICVSFFFLRISILFALNSAFLIFQ